MSVPETSVALSQNIVERPSEISNELWNELSHSARKGLQFLLENNLDDASNEDTKTLLPETTPWKYKGDLYKDFMKPKGFITINRSFLPPTLGENILLSTAMNNLPPVPSQDEIENMKHLITDLKSIVSQLAESKLELHFTEQFKQQQISYGTGFVQGTREASKAWRSEEMSKIKCEKYWKALYQSLEDGEVLAKIEYEIMTELKLWYSSTESLCDKTKRKGGRLKQGCVRHWIMNKVRDTFHARYYKVAQTPNHGVRLGVSLPGGRGREEEPRVNSVLKSLSKDGMMMK
jgi:hypothetical protein